MAERTITSKLRETNTKMRFTDIIVFTMRVGIYAELNGSSSPPGASIVGLKYSSRGQCIYHGRSLQPFEFPASTRLQPTQRIPCAGVSLMENGHSNAEQHRIEWIDEGDRNERSLSYDDDTNMQTHDDFQSPLDAFGRPTGGDQTLFDGVLYGAAAALVSSGVVPIGCRLP